MFSQLWCIQGIRLHKKHCSTNMKVKWSGKCSFFKFFYHFIFACIMVKKKKNLLTQSLFHLFVFLLSLLKVIGCPVNRLYWQCKAYFCSRSEPAHYGAPAHTKSNLCLAQTLISPSWILGEIWRREQLFSVGEQLQCGLWCLTSGENHFIYIFYTISAQPTERI